jgi:hypothetical protein
MRRVAWKPGPDRYTIDEKDGWYFWRLLANVGPKVSVTKVDSRTLGWRYRTHDACQAGIDMHKRKVDRESVLL